MTTVLEVQHLSKRYGDRLAIDDLSFAIGEGETYGLLGPNGAGKTTTIGMVVGILRRDEGTVVVAGRPHNVNNVKTKGLIGFVPQALALYPDLSGRENLRFFARLYGFRGRDIKRRTEEVLEATGLADRGNDSIDTYSGGMKRRINIAAGLLNRPRLLVLDEPTAGVDPQSRNSILESVEALTGEGIAVLYTTHYMEEAERLCDRVGILDVGQLKAEGTRRELVTTVMASDQVILEAAEDTSGVADVLGRLPEVQGLARDDSRIELLVDDARTHLPKLLEVASEAGLTVRSVEVREPDLETVFLHLTGKALRD